jgi:hypothetical protein
VAAGNQTWTESTGRILHSEVVAVSAMDDSGARCAVKTSYEKAGQQDETVSIRKINGQYFITELQ